MPVSAEYPILRLNVGGKEFLVSKVTALANRGSLLAALASGNHQNVPLHARMSVAILKETGEYFVERSSLIFDLVLQYARTGKVECPSYVCEHALKEELTFWRLIEDDTEKRRRRMESMMVPEEDEEMMGKGKMARMWHLFEYPRSSRLAMREEHSTDCSGPQPVMTLNKTRTHALYLVPTLQCLLVWWVRACFVQCHRCGPEQSVECSSLLENCSCEFINALSIFFILTSIVNSVVSTEPSLRSSCVEDRNSSPPDDHPTTPSPCNRAANDWYFDIIESICTVWFALEFSLRFFSCPQKTSFMRSPLNIIDFLATIPFCLEMVAYAFMGGNRYINSRDSGVASALLILMRVLRIIRVIRSFKLARYVNSLQLLCALAWNSRGDFGLLLLFLTVGTLIFSALMYHAEKDEQNTAYTSIPATFWWCVVTFSTVGYGDVTPTTTVGRILAGIACISGILIITFPVSIITDTFRCTYDAHKLQRRRGRARSDARRGAINIAMARDDNSILDTKF